MLMNGQVVGEAAEQVPPSRSATADNGTGLAMAAEGVALPPDVVLTGTRVRYRVPGSRKVLEMVVGGR